MAKPKTGNKKVVLSTPIIKLRDENRTDYREVVERYKSKVKNPKTAIRAYCVECSGGSLKNVQECPIPKCALYPFRMGVNPHNLKTMKRLGMAPANQTTDDEDEDQDES